MTTAATDAGGRGWLRRLFTDEVLAAASLALLVTVLLAIARGHQHWAQIEPLVWLHLATMLTALALTPVMLLRRKGTHWHRRLGYAWVSMLMVTAITTLFFKTGVQRPGSMGVFTGDISTIHGLSLIVLCRVPLIVIRARQHDRVKHERTVRGLIIGALLVAGFFTFSFNRLLGSWLFG